MKCSQCIFWVRNRGESETGECRRYPPTAMQAVNGSEGYVSSETYNLFPEILESRWCGEFHDRDIPDKLNADIKLREE